MAALSPLKRILDFIIYSNLFIAAGVACFTLQTALFFPEYNGIIEEFSILNFITTFILYNLQRLYYASKENLDEKYSWYVRNRRLIFTMMILLLMCFFSRILDFFLQHPDYFFIYFLLGLLSVFYFLPPLQLRKYGSLKPFIIAFVFVASSVILPLYKAVNLSLLLYAFGQFSFIAALCLLFDVKDYTHDQRLNVKTFPVKFSVQKTKYLCSFLILMYLSSVLVNVQQTVISAYFIIAALSVSLILLVNPIRNAYYYFYLVDGLILLQYFLIQFFLFP
jgi:4-hydroxybenzoate polyprenyltransferase